MDFDKNQMYLLMFKRLYTWGNDPTRIAITNSLPQFKANLDALNGKSAALDALYVLYQQTSRSATVRRKQSRIALTSFTYSVMSSVRTYANDRNLPALAQQMKITQSAMNKMVLQDLVAFVTNAINIVNPLVPSLAPYGITAGTITTWQTRLTDYSSQIPTPESLIDAHKATGENITLQTSSANTFVKNNLDPLATSFIQTHLDYYQGWRIARRLRHLGIRHTAADVTVVNELSVPFIGVTVQVDELQKDGRTFKAVSGTTDINGTVDVQTFESGIRTITVSGNGVVPKTFGPYKFVQGKALTLVLTCQPQFSNLPAPQPQNQNANS